MTESGSLQTASSARQSRNWQTHSGSSFASIVYKDPEAEARCYEWMAWASTAVHAVAFGQLVRPQRFVADPRDYPAVIAKGRQNVDEAFDYVEAS
jgi:glutathione S-transferase